MKKNQYSTELKNGLYFQSVFTNNVTEWQPKTSGSSDWVALKVVCRCQTAQESIYISTAKIM
jgi:hypothetical protein